MPPKKQSPKCIFCRTETQKLQTLPCTHSLCASCVTKNKTFDDKVLCPMPNCKGDAKIKVDPKTEALFNEYDQNLENREKDFNSIINNFREQKKNAEEKQQKQLKKLKEVFDKRRKKLDNAQEYQAKKIKASITKQMQQLDDAVQKMSEAILQIKKEAEDMRDKLKVIASSMRDELLAELRQEMEYKIKHSTQPIYCPEHHFDVSFVEKDFPEPTDDLIISAPPIVTPEWSAPTQSKEKIHSNMMPSLAAVCSKPWERQRGIDVTKPNSVRLVQQQLWLCHDRGITIYDAELKKQREISCGDMGCVYDVTALSSSSVVVATLEGLYHLNENGDERERIASGFFTSVCQHGGLLYAAEIGNPCVHVYQARRPWTQQRVMPLDCESHSTLTLHVNGNGIYVGYSRECEIKLFSLSGELLCTLGKRGREAAGELACPFLCGGDEDASLLVADCRNHRLQVVSSSGEWRVLTMQPPPDGPYSALLHNGKLYVSSCENDKLWVYSQT